MPAFTFVDKPDTITPELEVHPCLGVDTEFIREKTFYAQLCLLQVATPDRIYCVDPLAGNPMQRFWDDTFRKTWVVHSARQDIEVVFQSAGAMPGALFDTQIAAGLLGMQPQIGYAGLVKALFDVDLPKTHTRADWSQRPLPDALLHYAVEDVEHLLPAFELLVDRLDKAGRKGWAEQDSRLLLDESLYAFDGAQAIERLKGARNMRGRRRSAAERLAVWRETEAARRNRPRQWILRDTALLELAQKLPETLAALRGIDGLPPKLVGRAGEELLDVLAQAAQDDHDYRPPPAPNEQQKKLQKAMQAAVAKCADELGISPELVASRKELSAAILSGDTASRVFRGWRRPLIGERLLQLL
ncbi:MAG TPA: HRDC domain-containing protein [Woeseiaceae bacterium]|nr:HRDC domain-containing protein [Woeseiaceae bacterium]